MGITDNGKHVSNVDKNMPFSKLRRDYFTSVQESTERVDKVHKVSILEKERTIMY